MVNDLFNKFSSKMLNIKTKIDNESALCTLVDEESYVKIFKTKNHKYSSLIK